MKWTPTIKQAIAWDYLNDDITTELLYGGGLGGGKSYLGCMWLFTKCQEWPGSRWLMGRARLKNLKSSTLLTFFEICKQCGLNAEIDYRYNSMNGVITFENGSAIYLKDLFAYPNDPEFDSLGSHEYTGAFIDESSEIISKAKEILMSRLRYKLDEFNTIPKLLIATNPAKNFLYSEFYKKWKNKTLPKYRKFVQALLNENPYLPDKYKENVKKLDIVSKERLVYGNWEYDDDPSKLMEYDKIVDIFTNEYTKSDEKYLSVDPARFGQDLTVIMIWYGLYINKIYTWKYTDMAFVEEKIKELCKLEGIPRSNVIIDEDGIGGGIIDHLEGVKGFVNNASPIDKGEEKTNYRNLKTQCYFELANLVNSGKIGAKIEDETHKELIIQELEQIKRKDIDKDGKIALIGKDVIKENIGHSPDFADCMMMRMKFHIANLKEAFFEMA